MIKNKKGFNLFTALVSLMLISISLVLLFNMVKTENSYLSLIDQKKASSQIHTVADLAKADAFNLFLVSLRSRWEEYTNQPSNNFILRRNQIDMNWDRFVTDVGEDMFFNKKFSEYIAENLLAQLKYTQNPVGYDVSVDNFTKTNNSTDEKKEFAKIIRGMFLDSDKKIEVIDCNQEADYCLGTIYINLDTRNLSDENYNKIPKVTVLDLDNKEVIEKPILSRQNYKLYIPWRGFQAFRSARRIAYNVDREKSNDPKNYKLSKLKSYGVFNQEYHNAIDNARLGVCDPNTCMPRTDFFVTPSETGYESDIKLSEPCGHVQLINNNNLKINLFNVKYTLGENIAIDYNLGNSSTVDEEFEELVNSSVKELFTKRSGEKIVNDLNMIGGFEINSYNDIKFKEIDSETYASISKITKLVKNKIVQDKIDIKNISQKTYNPQDPLYNIAGTFGILEDYSDYFDVENIAPGAYNQELECYELINIDYYLQFKDTDNKYVVNGSDYSVYVTLSDKYMPFSYSNVFNGTINYNDTYGFFNVNSNNSNKINYKNKEAWICYPNTFTKTSRDTINQCVSHK